MIKLELGIHDLDTILLALREVQDNWYDKGSEEWDEMMDLRDRLSSVYNEERHQARRRQEKVYRQWDALAQENQP